MRSWSVKALGLAVLLLMACSNGHRSEVLAAPNFELKDLSGKTVRLESFRGHPVLLDFWATWCGPCQMSAPIIQEFYSRHKKDGLVVLGLNMDNDPSGVFAFVKHFKISYPILFAAGSSVSSDYEVQGLPHFVFIDKEGRIFQRYDGFGYELVRAWEDDLKKTLTANP